MSAPTFCGRSLMLQLPSILKHSKSHTAAPWCQVYGSHKPLAGVEKTTESPALGLSAFIAGDLFSTTPICN